MPQDYYSLVTNNGLIKEAQAGQIGGNPINLTEIAVGDGGGAYYEPDSSAVALINELHRTNLTSSVLDANNPNQLIIEGVIDEEVGPFFIREVGIFDSDGDLFAIGKYPETFKSNFASGSGKRLYIRMIIGFVSTPNVEIMISENINFDPNFEANLNTELDNLNNSLTNANNELNDRLKISQDLADLNNAATARGNLGLGSGAVANSATEINEGISQIATQGEVDAGTNDNKFITPLKLSSSTFKDVDLIATAVAANSSLISFTNLNSAYSKYRVEYHYAVPTVNKTGFYALVSTNNGSSYAASNYFSNHEASSTSDGLGSITGNTGRFTLSGRYDADANWGVRNDSNRGISGWFEIENPSQNKYKTMRGFSNYRHGYSSGFFVQSKHSGEYIGSLSPINAIKFQFISGLIFTGIFKLYGIK
ncbi:phage tail protein [Rickettsiales bacterium]|nr:phage tail protein [Rickettsiales bacterium]